MRCLAGVKTAAGDSQKSKHFKGEAVLGSSPNPSMVPLGCHLIPLDGDAARAIGSSGQAAENSLVDTGSQRDRMTADALARTTWSTSCIPAL